MISSWKHSPVRLGDDIFRDTVAPGVPAGRDLTSDDAVKLDRLGNEDSSALLELYEPLARRLRPDVALVALLALETSRVLLRDLERLEVVVELDLLVEDLLLRVVAVEKIRLCGYVSERSSTE
jgi:hypothetical protein